MMKYWLHCIRDTALSKYAVFALALMIHYSLSAQMIPDSKFTRVISWSPYYGNIRYANTDRESFQYNGMEQKDSVYASFIFLRFGIDFQRNTDKTFSYSFGCHFDRYSFAYLDIELDGNLYFGSQGGIGPFDYLDSTKYLCRLNSFSIPLSFIWNVTKNNTFSLIAGLSPDISIFTSRVVKDNSCTEFLKKVPTGNNNNCYQAFFSHSDYSAVISKTNLSYFFKARFGLNITPDYALSISPYFKMALTQNYGQYSHGPDDYAVGLSSIDNNVRYKLYSAGVEVSFWIK